MPKTIKPQNAAIKVAAIYALFSLLWISTSDRILYFFVKNSELLTFIQTIKGWLFVFVTSLIVFTLLYRELEKVRQATLRLWESEEKYRIMSELTGQMVYDYDVRKNCVEWSGCIQEITGFSSHEFEGVDRNRWEKMIHEQDREQVKRLFNEATEQASPFKAEYRIQHKDGNYTYIEDNGSFILDKQNAPCRMLGSIKDISERKKMELQLRQSQKMEAIGTLAGGIAHDFNNILGAIIGYAELARLECASGSQQQANLDQLLTASSRASELVKQILAFSRQNGIQKSIIYPSEIVKETARMLRATLPATIEMIDDISQSTSPVHMDPIQINQILINLATNSFHAMETMGGQLTIILNQETLDEADESAGALMMNSSSVHLQVSDTGPGIPKETLERVFDPFFTTKETGKGTGMGLSIVHGIVKNHGGHISINSEIGRGTVVDVWLPAAEDIHKPVVDTSPAPSAGGGESILFVDDEASLLSLAVEILSRQGYTVTTSDSGKKALNLFKQNPKQFDLLITDQSMPEMTGSELARQALNIRPDLPIILCTGYSAVISEEQAKEIGVRSFVHKPLSASDLARLVREAVAPQA